MSRLTGMKAITVGVRGKLCFECKFMAVEGYDYVATRRCTLYDVQIQNCDERCRGCLDDFGYDLKETKDEG